MDKDGNVADVISSPDSIPGRMNLGRLYAPYFSGAARDVRKLVLEQMGYNRHHKANITIDELHSVPDAMMQQAIATLLQFYSIVSPRMKREYLALPDHEKWEWIAMTMNETSKGAPRLYMPIEFDDEARLNGEAKFFDEMVEAIEKEFGHCLIYGPVSYVTRAGKRVTTKNNVRIAPIYFMELDKIADDWLAADIGKHSNFGILAAMNRREKYATPWRRTPPRAIGETEGRLYCMYGGRWMIAELIDRNGNIAVQREMGNKILRADKPTQIEKIVDRTKFEFNNTRPLQMLRHRFRCMGFDLVYYPEKKRAQ